MSVTYKWQAAKPQTASSMGIGRQVKRETAMVSYSISEAHHSGDRVILLAGPQSHDTVTFICELQHMPNSVLKFSEATLTGRVNNTSTHF